MDNPADPCVCQCSAFDCRQGRDCPIRSAENGRKRSVEASDRATANDRDAGEGEVPAGRDNASWSRQFRAAQLIMAIVFVLCLIALLVTSTIAAIKVLA